MRRDEGQLKAAMRSYRTAKTEGNRQEEARWANLIGDILKNRGEYVEALKWLRIDYEVTSKYLTEKHLLPTCQSLGEVYLRLGCFKDALVYQKKHLELAKDSNDLVEQQRASTQLGRTYHEMLMRSENDHYSIRNAKKYFKSSMKLAKTLKENPPSSTSSFLKEYIDAHNNMGMLEIDLDNLEEAQTILARGLEICDEEEVAEFDDARSRLHHNLGNVYMELRMWDEAACHIEKDIIICKNIGHCQGEAKGYINLGEFNYRQQKYDEAMLCYQKAFDLAKSMEDEDSLVDQICQNMETVKEAVKVMKELRDEEQNFKKLARGLAAAKGTSGERKCLLQQNKSLDCLIEKSSTIAAWLKHLEYAKRKKRVATELCDREKLSDSYLAIGDSYREFRNFSKALKWYSKSWENYKSIGNKEGQAMVKINIGDVLDCDGNWGEALDAFEEGYRIAVEARLVDTQLKALQNMHYSHMIRFDNMEEARRLQILINKLNQSKERELEKQNIEQDCCSETDTEGDDHLSKPSVSACSLPTSTSNSSRSNICKSVEELHDDVPLITFLHSNKTSKLKAATPTEKPNDSMKHKVGSPASAKSFGPQTTIAGRKRVRVVLSDDEDEMGERMEGLWGMNDKVYVETIATSDETKNGGTPATSALQYQDVAAVGSKGALSPGIPPNFEESICSYGTKSLERPLHEAKDYDRSLNNDEVVAYDFSTGGSKCNIGASRNISSKHVAVHLDLDSAKDKSKEFITFKIDNDLIHLVAGALVSCDNNVDSMKAELACSYYLQLPVEKRSKGLVPIIQELRCSGSTLEFAEAVESLKDHSCIGIVEVLIAGWIQKPLMRLYVDCCTDLSEVPNMKLLKRLYNLEVSEDEVVVSECELQDLSITPLLNALHTHGTIAVLNLSHNLLGNATMEKLQLVLSSSGQNYGDLSLDLHSNRFGPSSLFQICECPVLFERLAVLNISGNRLTDACGSYISTILKNCKALYSLNIENCSITSRTIQKVADALDAGSTLAQLFIGHNDLVSGNVIVNLISKLTTLRRFSELSLNGLKISKAVVDSLCRLAKAFCLSGLMLAGTSIGTDGALQLTESLSSESQELVKLDLSYCGLASKSFSGLDGGISLFYGISDLNLSGNTLMQEVANSIVSMLIHPRCSVKVLSLNKCQLGLSGVLQIIQALAGNNSLKELHLEDNVEIAAGRYNMLCGTAVEGKVELLEQSPANLESSPAAKDVNVELQALCNVNSEYNLEVADSEDNQTGNKRGISGIDRSCASSSERILPQECQLVDNLSTAIGLAKHLELLDLSNNGFSIRAAESFYASWSDTRGASASRHIYGQTIHLFVQGSKCCQIKPCCKRE